jgi:Chlorite dismutase
MSSSFNLDSKSVQLSVAIAGGLVLSAVALSSLLGASSGNQKSDRRLARLGAALLAKFGGKGSHPSKMPTIEPPQLLEKGHGGQSMDRRMYFQLRVLDVLVGSDVEEAQNRLIAQLHGFEYVLYRDASLSSAFGLLVWSENPDFFAIDLNNIIERLKVFVPREGFTMTGRTYANGHERDLEDFLLKKPVRNILGPDAEWGVWYPMRRKGEFYMETGGSQCGMLLHHAAIGKSYADVNAASDVRLKCYGIDRDDNEFVIGIIGKTLFPLSKIVEDLRKTEHTSRYMKTLGPFFIGKRIASSATNN